MKHFKLETDFIHCSKKAHKMSQDQRQQPPSKITFKHIQAQQEYQTVYEALKSMDRSAINSIAIPFDILQKIAYYAAMIDGNFAYCKCSNKLFIPSDNQEYPNELRQSCQVCEEYVTCENCMELTDMNLLPCDGCDLKRICDNCTVKCQYYSSMCGNRIGCLVCVNDDTTNNVTRYKICGCRAIYCNECKQYVSQCSTCNAFICGARQCKSQLCMNWDNTECAKSICQNCDSSKCEQCGDYFTYCNECMTMEISDVDWNDINIGSLCLYCFEDALPKDSVGVEITRITTTEENEILMKKDKQQQREQLKELVNKGYIFAHEIGCGREGTVARMEATDAAQKNWQWNLDFYSDNNSKYMLQLK